MQCLYVSGGYDMFLLGYGLLRCEYLYMSVVVLCHSLDVVHVCRNRPVGSVFQLTSCVNHRSVLSRWLVLCHWQPQLLASSPALPRLRAPAPLCAGHIVKIKAFVYRGRCTVEAPCITSDKGTDSAHSEHLYTTPATINIVFYISRRVNYITHCTH